MILVDLEGMGEGRLNGLRIDFNGIDIVNEPEFELCYMGCFRSEEEAEAYGRVYLGLSSDDATTPDSEEETAASGEETMTSLGNDVTDTPGTSSTTEASTEPANSGCGSVMGFGLVALITLAGAYLFKKKD